MNSQPEITLEETRDSADSVLLVKSLTAFNDSVAEPAHPKHFLFSAKDKDGTLLGGLKGYIHWNWLSITHLWVADTQKGNGLGSTLISKAEAFAIKNKCTSATVDTFSFQALPFYKKLGFEEFATLDDYPPGHRRHYLRKNL